MMIWCTTAVAEQDDPAFLNFGVGYYDLFDDDNAAAFRVEYRAESKFWIFKPFAGVSATSDGAAYGYGGVLTDFYFGLRIVATPSVAAGYYHNGDGKDLGHEFEIKSGLEIAYRFDNRARLGVHFHHISNGGLEDTKSGVEVLGINYSLPLR
ncbi:MAG: acyloxyacyl hydrolase [Rhodospirillaceae bacterium]|nr:acyloxyacyl hydrolase [Rhodospirillaceae bacterium]MBT6825734.1 acyloxyacyl hydrolase [Rhodospirillales bacterium]MBT4042337.1 acyloxyacyl hydrolase [Rhodospirillaceae bacterium]MBT5523077.1 acyloxyacyl hydrolase [Rhodospirillaceae bacterium]MBT5878228.1 acyloxyacyl hydrolase [Rhodospirillaceae bacterium]